MSHATSKPNRIARAIRGTCITTLIVAALAESPTLALEVPVPIPSETDPAGCLANQLRLDALGSHFPRIEQYEWPAGEPPRPEAFLNRFLQVENAEQFPPAGTSLIALTRADFGGALAPHTRQAGDRIFLRTSPSRQIEQEIVANGAAEAPLLAAAFREGGAGRETQRFRLLTDRGVLESQIFYGSFHQASADGIRVIRHLIQYARRHHLRIFQIEARHVHPGAELLNAETGSIRHSPFNAIDIQIALARSRTFPEFLLVESAVTPNGYSYQVEFKGGKVQPVGRASYPEEWSALIPPSLDRERTLPALEALLTELHREGRHVPPALDARRVDKQQAEQNVRLSREWRRQQEAHREAFPSFEAIDENRRSFFPIDSTNPGGAVRGRRNLATWALNHALGLALVPEMRMAVVGGRLGVLSEAAPSYDSPAPSGETATTERDAFAFLTGSSGDLDAAWRPGTLPLPASYSRRFIQNLKALDRDALIQRLSPYLTPRELEGLLLRRRLILSDWALRADLAIAP